MNPAGHCTVEEKIMETIVGNYESSDGKSYYNIALNLNNGKYIQIKNAGCSAVAQKLSEKYFLSSNVKVFFQSTFDKLNLEMIPKKYHKYFVELKK
jgi:hypothetical protein